MGADARKLARLHRVRALQLTLAQGQEARARDQADSERALSSRIRQLADAVAPVPSAAGAASLAAAAHYRERLHQSATSAEHRVAQADAATERAADATRAARQDRTAIEKLLERARREALIAEARALMETAGEQQGRKRR